MAFLQIDTSDGGSHNSWYDDKDAKEDVAILKRFDDMFHDQLAVECHDKFVLPLKRLSVLGKGASSTVYKSIYYPTMTIVAEKVVVIGDSQKRIQLCREVELLKSMLCSDDDDSEGNKALVQLIACFANPVEHTVSLCLEFMNSGSLEDILQDSSSRPAPSIPGGLGNFLDETVLHGIATQVLTSLAFLHEHRVIHRDLKPGNILINSKGLVKISDFGLSRALQLGCSVTQSFIGTYQYMAPERITGGEYSLSSDVWAAGMTLHTLAVGKYPYDCTADAPAAAPVLAPAPAIQTKTQHVRRAGAKAGTTSGSASVRGTKPAVTAAAVPARQTRYAVNSKATPEVAATVASRAPAVAAVRPIEVEGPTGANYWSIMHAIVERPVPSPPTGRFSAQFVDLINLMCSKDPKCRPSCVELLQHPFIVGSGPKPPVKAAAVVPAGRTGQGQQDSPTLSPVVLAPKPSREVGVGVGGSVRRGDRIVGEDGEGCRDSTQSVSAAATWLLRNSTQFMRKSQMGAAALREEMERQKIQTRNKVQTQRRQPAGKKANASTGVRSGVRTGAVESSRALQRPRDTPSTGSDKTPVRVQSRAVMVTPASGVTTSANTPSSATTVVATPSTTDTGRFDGDTDRATVDTIMRSSHSAGGLRAGCKDIKPKANGVDDGGDWLNRALLRSAPGDGARRSTVAVGTSEARSDLFFFGQPESQLGGEDAEVVAGWVQYLLSAMRHDSQVSVDQLRVTPDKVRALSEALQCDHGSLQRQFTVAIQRLLTAIHGDGDEEGCCGADRVNSTAERLGLSSSSDCGSAGEEEDETSVEASFIEEEEELLRSQSVPLPQTPARSGQTKADTARTTTAQVLSFGWKEGGDGGDPPSPVSDGRHRSLNASLVSEVAEDEELAVRLQLGTEPPVEVQELELDLKQEQSHYQHQQEEVEEEEEEESYMDESFEAF